MHAVKILSTQPLSTLAEIKEITGISISVLSTLANLTKHTWLKELLSTQELGKLKAATEQRKIKLRKPSKNIGAKLLSPSNKEYIVEHIANFAKENNLSESKICELMSGARKTHKGWKLSS